MILFLILGIYKFLHRANKAETKSELCFYFSSGTNQMIKNIYQTSVNWYHENLLVFVETTAGGKLSTTSTPVVAAVVPGAAAAPTAAAVTIAV